MEAKIKLTKTMLNKSIIDANKSVQKFLDYVTELGGSFLTVVNPTAKSSCGCGESFAV